MTMKPVGAWLIMWQWFGDHAIVEQPYVDIVSRRKEVPYIKEYLERLYGVHRLSLEDRAPLARYNQPERPPFEAEADRTAHAVEVHCGDNPFLVARQVRILAIDTDPDTGEETVRWEPYKP